MENTSERSARTPGLAVIAVCIMILVTAAVIIADSHGIPGLSGKNSGLVNNKTMETRNTSGIPPDAAIQSCYGKSVGDTCRFNDSDRISPGICDDRPGVLACAPSRNQGSGTRPDGNPGFRNVSADVILGVTYGDSGGFLLTSDAGVDGGTLPVNYTCDGSGSTIALSWSRVPAGTHEFALMMTTLPGDGTTRWNWVLYGIPGNVTGLARNSTGVGTLGSGSHGTVMKYDPPCSQGPGFKLYTFTVYALSSSPIIPGNASQVTGPVLTNAISSITLGKATLNLSYTRPF